MAPHPTHPVDVLLILTDGDRVLLALREGTGYADGQWNLPSGKLEHGEDALNAIQRETREEIGLHLTRTDLHATGAVHHRNTAGQGRIGLTFTAAHDPTRHGEPTNAEPHKCAKISWFPADMLPSNTYPYSTAAITAWRAQNRLALSGWAD
ncbi:NUDIX domain-containing protein [Catenuloplanes japonicus]|uniref:NUDIX domain-containing protein n=1 Tax=Catenuloplanes japonicus TaxID=33876 RepID=UPI000A105634|nr:NUDIX domain-containing protein [Catenuloplanes japonicus]